MGRAASLAGSAGRSTIRPLMSLVTRAELDRALAVAKQDFASCGLYTPALDDVPVRLTSSGEAYGYFSDEGVIEIPAWSWSRAWEQLDGEACCLEDVLRHELAHALADRYMELVDTPHFERVFGAGYWDEWVEHVEYDPRNYVTHYATTAPCEDFAETVMVYARHRGRVSRFAARAGVMRGFRFVASLARELSSRRAPASAVVAGFSRREAARRGRGKVF